MEKGIVYKQRYSSVSEKATIHKNIAHLIYIATRPGTIYNEDCAFGLWGKLRDMKFAGNINNLEAARERVNTISSERKTIYRGVFSLESLDAKNKGYLTREKWQQLITTQVSKIALEKNMNIAPGNFEWMASYHNEPDHPHCHIVFWDSSDKVREEFIPQKRFEIMAENIRAEFNREIYRDEIQNLFRQSDDLKSQIKEMLQCNLTDFEKTLLFKQSDYEQNQDIISLLCGAMVDVNACETMSLRFTGDYLTRLAKDIDNVIIHSPTKGSLKYQYLTPKCKEAVDQLTDTLLKNHDFKKLKNEFIRSRVAIAQLYGNSAETVQHNTEVALKSLYSDIGNLLLGRFKELGLLKLHSKKGMDYFDKLYSEAPTLALSELVDTEDYKKLQDAIPEMRLPMKRFMDKVKWQRLNNLSYFSPFMQQYRSLSLKLFEKDNAPNFLGGDTPKVKCETLQRQISHTVLEQIKREKGWYQFQDKINACTNLIEVEVLFTDIQSRLSSTIAKVIRKDANVITAMSAIQKALPTYYQPFDTFYNEDFRKVVDTAVQALLENDAVYSLGFDYIDCKLKAFSLQPPDLPMKESTSDKPTDPLRSLAYSCLYKEMIHDIMDYCLEEKGWKSQYRNEASIRLISNVFSLLSQSVSQQINQRAAISGQARKLFSKDMSKQQKIEIAKKLKGSTNSYENEWVM